jgi:2-phosphoglycerate kinase
MDKITIIKRDGSEEAFEKDKIQRVLIVAGLPSDQAYLLAEDVDTWIKSNGEPKVSSLVLRDKILELLQERNPEVANLYQWYEGTKDQK